MAVSQSAKNGKNLEFYSKNFFLAASSGIFTSTPKFLYEIITKAQKYDKHALLGFFVKNLSKKLKTFIMKAVKFMTRI